MHELTCTVNDLEGHHSRSSELPLFDKRQLVCSNSVYFRDITIFTVYVTVSDLEKSFSFNNTSVEIASHLYTHWRIEVWEERSHRFQTVKMTLCHSPSSVLVPLNSISHKIHKWFPKVVFHSNCIFYRFRILPVISQNLTRSRALNTFLQQ